MNKKLPYLAILGIFLTLVILPKNSFGVTAFNEGDVKIMLTDQYNACFSAQEKLDFSSIIDKAVADALARKYCWRDTNTSPTQSLTGEEISERGGASAVEGWSALLTKDVIEETVSQVTDQIEAECQGVVMQNGSDGEPKEGTAWAKCKPLITKRNALRNSVQSYYDHGNLISSSQNVDCSKARNEIIGGREGLSISSYNSISGTTNTSLGFTSTDSSGKQTFITPVDIFVSDSQSLFDSAKELKDKCLASCKQKEGTVLDCNKMCLVSRSYV
jgi:hypothetical protein